MIKWRNAVSCRLVLKTIGQSNLGMVMGKADVKELTFCCRRFRNSKRIQFVVL